MIKKGNGKYAKPFDKDRLAAVSLIGTESWADYGQVVLQMAAVQPGAGDALAFGPEPAVSDGDGAEQQPAAPAVEEEASLAAARDRLPGVVLADEVKELLGTFGAERGIVISPLSQPHIGRGVADHER